MQGKEIERLNKVYGTILKNAGVEFIGALAGRGKYLCGAKTGRWPSSPVGWRKVLRSRIFPQAVFQERHSQAGSVIRKHAWVTYRSFVTWTVQRGGPA